MTSVIYFDSFFYRNVKNPLLRNLRLELQIFGIWTELFIYSRMGICEYVMGICDRDVRENADNISHLTYYRD